MPLLSISPRRRSKPARRTPGFRALLGNAYFGSGRFASAQGAYNDSLALAPAQPQVILKRALVQIALGKNSEAISSLQAAQGLIDPADYGLALALAGQPYDAVQVLETAARAQGADSRVRQNLALAYAISGDWTTLARLRRRICPPTSSMAASSSGCRSPSRLTPTTRLPRSPASLRPPQIRVSRFAWRW